MCAVAFGFAGADERLRADDSSVHMADGIDAATRLAFPILFLAFTGYLANWVARHAPSPTDAAFFVATALVVLVVLCVVAAKIKRTSQQSEMVLLQV